MKKKILILDDEATIRELTAEMLDALGHHADTASSSREAIEMYKEASQKGEAYDLVIFDLNIKGDKNGFETLREIKKFDASIKAVAATGYMTSDLDINRDIQELFDRILTKPYSIATLDETITELTQQDNPHK